MKRSLSLVLTLPLVAWAVVAPGSSVAAPRADCVKIHEHATQFTWFLNDDEDPVAWPTPFRNPKPGACWIAGGAIGGWYTGGTNGNDLAPANLGDQDAQYHIIYQVAVILNGIQTNGAFIDSVDLDGVEQPGPEGCEGLAGAEPERGTFATRYHWDAESGLMTKAGTWPAFHCFPVFDSVVGDTFTPTGSDWQKDPSSGHYKRFFQEPMTMAEGAPAAAEFIDRADLIDRLPEDPSDKGCAATTKENAKAYKSDSGTMVESPGDNPAKDTCLDEISVVALGWYKLNNGAWVPTRRTAKPGAQTYKVFYADGGNFDLRSGIVYDGLGLSIDPPPQNGCAASIGEFGAMAYKWEPGLELMRHASGYWPFHCFEDELTDKVTGHWFHPQGAFNLPPSTDFRMSSRGEYEEFLKDPETGLYVNSSQLVKPMIENP